MTKASRQKGASLVSVVIIVTIAFAALNAYAYFNPSLGLSRYSLVNLLNNARDRQRIDDLKTLEAAVIAFYNKNNHMPTVDGWCGRISNILHPEFTTQMAPFVDKFVYDPAYKQTSKDYFYYRVDRARYILMAVLDDPPDQGAGAVYNFVKCHDWPGNDVYNYQIRNF